MRILHLVLVAAMVAGAALTLPSAEAAPASVKTATQSAFCDAFVRMDAHWPNVSSHDYWLALRDADDYAVKLTPAEKTNDADVVRDLKVLPIYRNCWMALVAKERALSEFVIGQIVLAADAHDLDAAREHFAMAAASWDEAFRLWPYMADEKVRGDSPSGRGDLVGTGFAWRAQAQKQLADVTPR